MLKGSVNPMMKAVFLEQKDVFDCQETAFKGTIKNSDIIYKGKFSGVNEFKKILLEGMTELFKCADKDIKLMVVSAHGVQLTATQLDAGNSEFIDWYFLNQYFEVVPKNLIIYLNVCFGLYPDSWQLQKDNINKPILIAPLVDIRVDHANQIQDELINCLSGDNNTESAILKLIDRYNSPNYMSAYANRIIVGCLKKDGSIYPYGFEGQLCAPVYEPDIFKIVDLFTPGEKEQSGFYQYTNCVLERNGEKYIATNSRLYDIASTISQLKNSYIKIKYQIYKDCKDHNYGRLEIINKPKLIRSKT